MSLPVFNPQAHLFGLQAVSHEVFDTGDRYRLFAEKIYPLLGQARPRLEQCYCEGNGRAAIEPALLLGVRLLQFLERAPDRQAAERVKYHIGWKFGLNEELKSEGLHPAALVRCRERLMAHEQGRLAFEVVLGGLRQAGLVPKKAKQRLDSAHVLGLVSRMSSLECVRESLRLALEELEKVVGEEQRPEFWGLLWERYVESQLDYKTAEEGLRTKMRQAGQDILQLEGCVGEPVQQNGEPTKQFITAVVTQPATRSDEAGMEQVFEEQNQMGLDKPSELYVDGAYVSAQELAKAQAEGWELMGPAQPSGPRKNGFCAEAFGVEVEQRRAVCPAGQPSTQCSRLEEEKTGRVSYRFEWSWQCRDCGLREQCLGPGQSHRTLVVGQNHTVLQARRQEMKTETFQQRMKQRNGIEATHSELVRAHGIRRARYRGLKKVALQNYFIGAACNVKRWINLMRWEIQKIAAGVKCVPQIS